MHSQENSSYCNTEYMRTISGYKSHEIREIYINSYVNKLVKLVLLVLVVWLVLVVLAGIADTSGTNSTAGTSGTSGSKLIIAVAKPS